MKTSTRVLLFTGLGLWVLLTIAVLNAARHIPPDSHDHGTNAWHGSGSLVTVPTGEGAFERVSAQGAWDITLYNHPTCTVAVQVPHDKVESVKISREAGSLSLTTESAGVDKCTAAIGLPDLTRLDLKGMASVTLEHFSLDDLSIKAEGMSDIKTRNVLIERLTYRSEGVCHADLRDQGVTQADVHAQGLGEIEITMRGGSLSGSLEGLIKIDYDGDILENTLKTSGFAKVSK